MAKASDRLKTLRMVDVDLASFVRRKVELSKIREEQKNEIHVVDLP